MSFELLFKNDFFVDKFCLGLKSIENEFVVNYIIHFLEKKLHFDEY